MRGVVIEATKNHHLDRGTCACAQISVPPSEVGIVQAEVEVVIEIIRPAIQADGGDIALIDVDQESGIVIVELSGACVSCPASTVTMKAGIERIMIERVPGVTAVVQPGEDAELGAGGRGGAPAGAGGHPRLDPGKTSSRAGGVMLAE